MTSGIDMRGPDISDAFAQHLETMKNYEEGRIAGSRHAQRSATDGSPSMVYGCAEWQGEGPEWFLRGFCDSLAAYEIAC